MRSEFATSSTEVPTQRLQNEKKAAEMGVGDNSLKFDLAKVD